MALTITGTITKILDVQTGEKKDGSGQWEKQNFIVDSGEQYNNIYCFEIFGDQKVDNFKKFNSLGQKVSIEFNVNTNEYQGKYYTTLSAWKITNTGGVGSAADYAAPTTQPQPQQVFTPATDFKEEDHDDLPF